MGRAFVKSFDSGHLRTRPCAAARLTTTTPGGTGTIAQGRLSTVQRRDAFLAYI